MRSNLLSRRKIVRWEAAEWLINSQFFGNISKKRLNFISFSVKLLIYDLNALIWWVFCDIKRNYFQRHVWRRGTFAAAKLAEFLGWSGCFRLSLLSGQSWCTSPSGTVKPLDVEKQLLEGEGSAPLHCRLRQSALSISVLLMKAFRRVRDFVTICTWSSVDSWLFCGCLRVTK